MGLSILWSGEDCMVGQTRLRIQRKPLQSFERCFEQRRTKTLWKNGISL